VHAYGSAAPAGHHYQRAVARGDADTAHSPPPSSAAAMPAAITTKYRDAAMIPMFCRYANSRSSVRVCVCVCYRHIHTASSRVHTVYIVPRTGRTRLTVLKVGRHVMIGALINHQTNHVFRPVFFQSCLLWAAPWTQKMMPCAMRGSANCARPTLSKDHAPAVIGGMGASSSGFARMRASIRASASVP
jgi:hypothetical protein